jgi:hypothetical protein
LLKNDINVVKMMESKNKKNYNKPELTSHGDVRKMTEGSGPSGGDVNDKTYD